jgi:hypothetical protein
MYQAFFRMRCVLSWSFARAAAVFGACSRGHRHVGDEQFTLLKRFSSDWR